MHGLRGIESAIDDCGEDKLRVGGEGTYGAFETLSIDMIYDIQRRLYRLRLSQPRDSMETRC